MTKESTRFDHLSADEEDLLLETELEIWREKREKEEARDR
jgi:hypothetical protein